MEKNLFQERLIAAMNSKNINSQRLSEKTGIDKSSISCYRSGKYRASTENLYKMAQELEVNEAWLMGREGVPMKNEDIPPSKERNRSAYLNEQLSKNEALHSVIIERYEFADEKIKKAVRTLLDIGDHEYV